MEKRLQFFPIMKHSLLCSFNRKSKCFLICAYHDEARWIKKEKYYQLQAQISCPFNVVNYKSHLLYYGKRERKIQSHDWQKPFLCHWSHSNMNMFLFYSSLLRSSLKLWSSWSTDMVEKILWPARIAAFFLQAHTISLKLIPSIGVFIPRRKTKVPLHMKMVWSPMVIDRKHFMYVIPN